MLDQIGAKRSPGPMIHRKCGLVREAPVPLNAGADGGGNMVSADRITVRRWAAIGDALAASVVADKLAERGYTVWWVSQPILHCMLRRRPSIALLGDAGSPDVDLDGAYERDPMRRRRHLSEVFMARANDQLARYGIGLGPALNCRPRMYVSAAERRAWAGRLAQYPRPWVMICPRSDTYACRQVPDGVWREAAKGIPGTKFWLGRHPAPAGIVDLKIQHLDLVIGYLSVADLLVTVDTGPMHIGAALGVPVLALGQSSSPELHLSDQADFVTLNAPDLGCLNCQQNLCPINAHQPPCQNFRPEAIAAAATAKLGQVNSGRVSAVVAIWKPDAAVLNHCLADVVDQVDEVIVAAEAKSVVPSAMMRHPKIRLVECTKSNIGYSGNANFGARHSTGQYLLMLNDDCFLKPGAVEGMKREMKPGVGIVSNLLRYPDGTIYHAGKVRAPGVRGWGHINHRQTHCPYQQVTEMENVCGCCILVRREVFYHAGALDEELKLFAQDDALCLSVRREGWKILFTPFSEGVHMEHQSVKKVGDVMTLVGEANSHFTRKWGWYLESNLNRVPGTFC